MIILLQSSSFILVYCYAWKNKCGYASNGSPTAAKKDVPTIPL